MSTSESGPDRPSLLGARRGARIGASASIWARAHQRRSGLIAIALVLVVVALADWPLPSSRSQRQSDFESYVAQIRGDVLSCGTEVEDSLSAYNQIMAGASTERTLAEGIIDGAALDCTPSGNSMILDLAAAQPPRSLAAAHLDVAASQLYGWASADAVDAMQGLHSLLVSPGDPVLLAQLRSRLADMQQRAAAAQSILDRAAAAAGAPSESLSLDAVQPGVLVG